MRRGPIPLAFYFIPIAALAVLLPLILHGCSCGHDFDFHLISWMEAAAQFKAGNMHPSWAFSPGWNAGEPRFVFYPPVSWTVGAILGILLPWTAAPIVYTWIALVASASAMYVLGRTLKASEHASLIASVVYLANPYMLFTAYERTAYAELLSAAWIPLLLAAILRERVTPLRIAIPIALLWLTNAPAAVMGCYSLAVLAALRLLLLWLNRRSGKSSESYASLAGRVIAGLGLGLGLAAFYILPAAYERRWVQITMATIEGMRIQDNFLFHHTSDPLHDEVLHTASLIAIEILLATVVVFVTVLLRRSRPESSPAVRSHALPLALLALFISILLTPVSAPFWRIAPEMTFLQFPWRLTAILAAILCGGVALALGPLRLRRTILITSAVILTSCLAWPSVSSFTQPCDDEDNVAARLAVFDHQMGTDPTDEYTPTNADNESLAHTNPPFWLAEDGDAAATSTGQAPGPVPMHLSVTVPRAEVIVLNLRTFPAWLIRVNGNVAKERVDRADGLIAVPLPAGRSKVDISYATTPDRRAGEWISLIAICTVLASALRRREPSL